MSGPLSADAWRIERAKGPLNVHRGTMLAAIPCNKSRSKELQQMPDAAERTKSVSSMTTAKAATARSRVATPWSGQRSARLAAL